MTDASDPKPPTDPRGPCAICGSTDHISGHHDGGAPPGSGYGGVPPGYHDGGDYPTSLETEQVLEDRIDERP